MRKHIDRLAYLVLDDVDGTIAFEGHLYSESVSPTPIIAFFATFNEDEAAGVSICEVGLFGGPVCRQESTIGSTAGRLAGTAASP